MAAERVAIDGGVPVRTRPVAATHDFGAEDIAALIAVISGSIGKDRKFVNSRQLCQQERRQVCDHRDVRHSGDAHLRGRNQSRSGRRDHRHAVDVRRHADCPNGEALMMRGCRLAIQPSFTDEDIQDVVRAIRKVARACRERSRPAVTPAAR